MSAKIATFLCLCVMTVGCATLSEDEKVVAVHRYATADLNTCGKTMLDALVDTPYCFKMCKNLQHLPNVQIKEIVACP
ncbi:MAG: hypothetical protein RLZZ324_958 [Candidatus Parcubacteria bacterium]|jgi:hypothetical protein